LTRNDILKFANDPKEVLYFITNRFQLADGTRFSHIWYCNM
jgi:hypothetical protein